MGETQCPSHPGVSPLGLFICHQTLALGVLQELWDHQTQRDQVFLCFPEQTDVWNAVATHRASESPLWAPLM